MQCVFYELPDNFSEAALFFDSYATDLFVRFVVERYDRAAVARTTTSGVAVRYAFCVDAPGH